MIIEKGELSKFSDDFLREIARQADAGTKAAAEEVLQERKAEQVLKRHTIWQDAKPGPDGRRRWRAWIHKGTKRVQLCRKTRAALIEALAEWDAGGQERERTGWTFEQAYREWRKFADDPARADANTVSKRNTDWVRHFEGRKFIERPLTAIKSDELLNFCLGRIKKPTRRGKESDVPLCRRSARQFWEYIWHSFRVAEEAGWITAEDNPARKIDLKRLLKACRETERPKERETVPAEDLAAIRRRLAEDMAEKPQYSPSRAVFLALLTGMRASEIAGLRWAKVDRGEDGRADAGGYIHVEERESTDKLTRRRRQKAETKNGKKRLVPITPDVKKLLDGAIDTAGGTVREFVFTRADGSPLTVGVISSCLKNRCLQLGITTQGIHALRRTVDSVLIERVGTGVKAAAETIGNSPSVNERYYHRSVAVPEERRAALEEANRLMLGKQKEEKKEKKEE